MVTPIFSKVMRNVLNATEDEPMVDEKMGIFGDIRIPVNYRPGADQNYSADYNSLDYVTPQTQEEHNSLLNTYYPYRKNMKNWKELGRAAEKDSPHYSDTDKVIRKDIGARSSVISDIAYDKTNKLAMLKINGQWYTYSASPEQFNAFLQAGSLGREMNRIKNDRSTSMNKTAIRKTPRFSDAGRIASLFGL